MSLELGKLYFCLTVEFKTKQDVFTIILARLGALSFYHGLGLKEEQTCLQCHENFFSCLDSV